jgi:hypothetical protein
MGRYFQRLSMMQSRISTVDNRSHIIFRLNSILYDYRTAELRRELQQARALAARAFFSEHCKEALEAGMSVDFHGLFVQVRTCVRSFFVSLPCPCTISDPHTHIYVCVCDTGKLKCQCRCSYDRDHVYIPSPFLVPSHTACKDEFDCQCTHWSRRDCQVCQPHVSCLSIDR